MAFLRKYSAFIVMLLIWTFLMTGSLAWNYLMGRNSIMDRAYEEAKTTINKDITFRRWSAAHGGVYVPVTEKQQPIEWLEHIPLRDIQVNEEKQLTLVNPAAMLRQMMERYDEEFGVQGRITSLDPLNSKNAPDDWEKEQLMAFEGGNIHEKWAVDYIDGKPYLRYLRAMVTEKACLKCHEAQGYKVGEIRGGLGVKLPLSDYYKLIDNSQRNLFFTHGTIWSLGVLAIFFYASTNIQHTRERIEREKEKEKAANKLRLYANAFHSSGEPTLIINEANQIVDANAAFLEHTGYLYDDVLMQNWQILHSDKTPDSTYLEMERTLEKENFWQGEAYGRKKNGDVFPKWLSISKIQKNNNEQPFYISNYTDITKRKEAEDQISHLAHHDILTKLHNRYSLKEHLSQAIRLADKENTKTAILFIDLDRFKTINDSLGHQFGDKLLIEVASQLHSAIREQDILARFGGDEFVLVLSRAKDTLEIATIAQRVQERVNQIYKVDNREMEISASIGISIYPDDGHDTSELMKNADIAMYQAKEKGRNNYQFFTESLSHKADERLKLEYQLRAALNQKQFKLYYQPIMNASGEEAESVEALIRWIHPENGFIPPDKFIPVAEETGFIHPLGDWILEEACSQFSQFRKKDCPLNRISINLSVNQLQSRSLIAKVTAVIQKYAIEPGELEFEITETAAMSDPDFAVSQLNALSKLGVSLAIDDFGTGYSSLAYLKKLPIQTLKLDKAFVGDIGKDINDEEICIATITLAHNLGLKVVAEGVETKEQLEFLQVRGCDHLQGYYFSRPLPLDELCEFFSNESQKD